MKRVPSPGRLSTLMLPPCCSTICLAMERPSPVPFFFVVKNGSKMRARVVAFAEGGELRAGFETFKQERAQTGVGFEKADTASAVEYPQRLDLRQQLAHGRAEFQYHARAVGAHRRRDVVLVEGS